MAHAFTFASVDLTARPSGALYWAAERTLVVSDLHFEKGSSSAARGGAFLPPYDSRETLAELSREITDLNPARVICLGDSFHDPKASERLPDEDRATLERMIQDRDWVWILGNHDPLPPEGLGGRVIEELALGPLTFRHIAEELDLFAGPGEVSGHYHPKAAVSVRGRRLTGRCFIHDDKKLIMPAFGAYTGGLSVLDPAIANLLSSDAAVLLCGSGRVVPLTAKRLRVRG